MEAQGHLVSELAVWPKGARGWVSPCGGKNCHLLPGDRASIWWCSDSRGTSPPLSLLGRQRNGGKPTNRC